jgi:fermentation-respiration switch protein FrsA (DUF1100 family)
MAHGFTATIAGMTADRYAEVFQAAGFAVLLYDHCSFGASDGEPRREINKWVQARGYRDAVTFAGSLDEVDATRLAVWGDSMSGAVAIVVGSVDPRVKVILAQVPACGAEPVPADPDGALLAALRERLLHGEVDGTVAKLGPLPVVSFDQRTIPSLLTPLTAYRWFIEYGGRYGTGWENSATVVTLTDAPVFHAGLCVPHAQAALLMVVAIDDEMPGAESSVARSVYQAAAEPKALLEIDGGHFGLLHYPSEIFDQASAAQRDFLLKHL